jgi:hypothetical protein
MLSTREAILQLRQTKAKEEKATIESGDDEQKETAKSVQDSKHVRNTSPYIWLSHICFVTFIDCRHVQFLENTSILTHIFCGIHARIMAILMTKV